MDVVIDAGQLRQALAEIQRAEGNGFHHCLAVFTPSLAPGTTGLMLSDRRLVYSDLCERAHPTNPRLDWGRSQGVTRRYRFVEGELVPLKADNTEARA